jgi:hypothetical protein
MQTIRNSITKHYIQLYLGLLMLLITSSSFVKIHATQSCPNELKNDEFKLSLCMEPDWYAEVKGPYLIISKDKIRITFYKEKLSDKKSPETTGNERLDKDLKTIDYHGLALTKKEKLTVDGVDAFLVMTHMPSANKDGHFQNETTFMTIYYNHAGLRFAINNNCYSSDCTENIKMFMDLASRLKLK